MNIRLVFILNVILFTGCMTNPATGEREFSLVSEKQEIAMGQQAHEGIVQSIGVYEDAQLNEYVSQVGKKLAAKSERPDLPWTFTVVDDPVVNAFALPGGYIYLTRGILAHLTSEAQLAGVLGHEIAHVTARHSASQMSKATLANLGLGLGVVLNPDLAKYGKVAQTGVSLLFLKFGRDDERQSDELGLKYMTELNYRPHEITEVFKVLAAVSQLQGRSGLPGWLQTHPEPEERIELINEQISERGAATEKGLVEEQKYLENIEGIIYGENPRQGFFTENVLYHPDLRFKMVFPSGWTTMNQTHAAGAVNEESTAAISIGLAQAETVDAAAKDFFSRAGLQAKPGETFKRASIEGKSYFFQGKTENTAISGLAQFVSYGGKIYQITGYTAAELWQRYSSDLTKSMASFSELNDKSILNKRPLRLKLLKLKKATTLQALVEERGSDIPLDRLALMNHVAVDERLPRGKLIKVLEPGSSNMQAQLK